MNSIPFEIVVRGCVLARHPDYSWCCEKALEILRTFPQYTVSIEGGPTYRPEGERAWKRN